MTMSHQVIKRLWLSHGVFCVCVSVLDSSVPRGASCHIMRQHCEGARVSEFRSRSSGTCQKLHEWAWNRILSQSSLEKTEVSWDTLTHTQLSYLQILSSQKFSSVQFIRSVMSDSATPWTAACQASLSITNSQSLLKLMSIKSVMPSNLSSSVVPSPPTFNFSQHHSLFQWVSSSYQVAKVLEFQLQHQSFL